MTDTATLAELDPVEEWLAYVPETVREARNRRTRTRGRQATRRAKEGATRR